MNVFQAGKIDYQGQKLAEKLAQGLLFGSGAIAFGVGFALQDLYTTLILNVVGLALTLIVCLPPWPIYTKHPIKWLEPISEDDSDDEEDSDEKSKKSTKEKEERSWLGYLAKLLF